MGSIQDVSLLDPGCDRLIRSGIKNEMKKKKGRKGAIRAFLSFD